MFPILKSWQKLCLPLDLLAGSCVLGDMSWLVPGTASSLSITFWTFEGWLGTVSLTPISIRRIKNLFQNHISVQNKCGHFKKLHVLTHMYTECFTTCGHYCRTWFPRSLWSKNSYKYVSDFGQLQSYGHFLIPVHAFVWTMSHETSWRVTYSTWWLIVCVASIIFATWLAHPATDSPVSTTQHLEGI